MANKAMLFMQQINNQIEELKNQDSVNTAQLEELYRQRDNYERFPVGKRNYKNTEYNHLRNQIYSFFFQCSYLHKINIAYFLRKNR